MVRLVSEYEYRGCIWRNYFTAFGPRDFIRGYQSVPNLSYWWNSWIFSPKYTSVLLDGIVYTFIRRVGHSYGRRSVHGLLRLQGFSVSQARLARAMCRVAPIQHLARQRDTHWLMNPFPYQAWYLVKNFIWTQMKSVQCLVWHMCWLLRATAAKLLFYNNTEKEPCFDIWSSLLIVHYFFPMGFGIRCELTTGLNLH